MQMKPLCELSSLPWFSTDKAQLPASDRSEESGDDFLMDSSSTNDVSRLLPNQPASSSALRKQRGREEILLCRFNRANFPQKELLDASILLYRMTSAFVFSKALTVQPLSHQSALLQRHPWFFRPPQALLHILDLLHLLLLGRPPVTDTPAPATNIVPIKNGSPPPKARAL